MTIFEKISRSIDFWWFQKNFYRRFDFYTTPSQKELDEIYRLRYSVYCEEYGYLDKKNYPGKKESDEYDRHSVHFVLRSKSGEIAATVRMILFSPDGFPIEKHFRLDIHVPQEKRMNIAEISRLIVAKKYRKKFYLH